MNYGIIEQMQFHLVYYRVVLLREMRVISETWVEKSVEFNRVRCGNRENVFRIATREGLFLPFLLRLSENKWYA